MPELATLSLARAADAPEMAAMSRDLIEHGLGWSWTAGRVRRFIEGRDSLGLVARRERRIVAFAIMQLGDETAHLNLLAVAPGYRLQGLGRRMIDWLRHTCTEAGVFRIDLELCAANVSARLFYERLGFAAGSLVPGYYQGREAALRMSLRLDQHAGAGR